MAQFLSRVVCYFLDLLFLYSTFAAEVGTAADAVAGVVADAAAGTLTGTQNTLKWRHLTCGRR
jgi:hypothetical protein